MSRDRQREGVDALDEREQIFERTAGRDGFDSNRQDHPFPTQREVHLT